MDSDLMPNDGAYYHQPEEQVQEENAERAEVQRNRDLLDKLIERMEERIAFYDSLKSIQPDVKDTPEEHLRACIAANMTRDNLVTEKDYMEGLRNTYIS